MKGKRAIVRSCLLATALIYLAALLAAAGTEWLLTHPTPENLARGVRWFPSNAELWRAYARSQSSLMGDSNLDNVIAAYRKALARNPFDWVSWDNLATAYERQGDLSRSEAVLRATVALIPNSPGASWRLANFLLVQDREEESFPLFRTAVTYDPSLRLPVFDIGWKLLEDPQRILEQLVPDDPQARIDFMNFLVGRKRLVKEAYPVWEKIRPAGSEAVIERGESYTEALAAAGFGVEAERVWKSLLDQSAGTDSASDGQGITNGDFEAPLRNAGLDWRMRQAAGYQITLDNFQSQSGTRSLRVQFDGTTNPEFDSVQQWVPVQPGTNYRLRAYLKTENISSDNGMYLVVSSQGTPPEESWSQATAAVLGTAPWAQQQIDFRTGPNTRVILIRLRRRRSSKLNNLLQGTVWLDNASLQPLKD